MFTREQIIEVYEKIQDPAVNAEEVYQSLVSSATQDLDTLMQQIYTEVVMVEDVPTSIVQKYFTQLGNYVYFIGERMEKLGLRADISKQSMKEAYNEAYNNNLVNPVDNKKRTATDLNVLAEEASLTESVLNDIYQRAYKTVKFKVDSAQNMISTLSKVFSKKMQEQDFSRQFDNSRILME